MHNYDYLGAYSLPDGKDIILTIKETKKEVVTGTAGKKEECFVCYFQENVKPMILNRTNSKMIGTLYSDYIEDWPGRKVQIGSEKVKAFGEVTEALRIRQIVPNQKKEELTPDHPQWNNIIQKLKGDASMDVVKKHFEISEENEKKLEEAVMA